MPLPYGGGGVAVRARGAIRWGAVAFDGPVAVNGAAWGASTGVIAHHAPSLPAWDGLGAALHHRQPRQDLVASPPTSAGSWDRRWTETFSQANGWTFEVTGGELVVTDIDSSLACNRYGEQWSHALIQQSFAAVDDYRLEVNASWDSGGASAIQEIRIRLIGTSVNCAVVYQVHTHDLFVPFCAATGDNYRQLDGVAGAGSGSFRFESCGGDLNVFFNGNLMLSMPSEPVTGVQISFGYYKVNDLGTDTTLPCSAGGTVSTFGEIRVQEVILESPPPGSTPGTACGI